MVKRILILLLLLCNLPVWAAVDSVHTERFSRLAQQLNIRQSKLKQGEYQVRVWEKVALAYGDAQKLYVIDKKRKNVKLMKYTMSWNKQIFKGFTRSKPKQQPDEPFWQEMVQLDLLTLPDKDQIREKIFPKQKPRDYSSRVKVNSDSTVVVTAQKAQGSHLIMGDGVGYIVEVLGKDYFHTYSYSNPLSYAKARPEVDELQKIAVILFKIKGVFGDDPLRY
ncbi:hypothetical protein [Nibrella saemangeumensis]